MARLGLVNILHVFLFFSVTDHSDLHQMYWNILDQGMG